MDAFVILHTCVCSQCDTSDCTNQKYDFQAISVCNCPSLPEISFIAVAAPAIPTPAKVLLCLSGLAAAVALRHSGLPSSDGISASRANIAASAARRRVRPKRLKLALDSALFQRLSSAGTSIKPSVQLLLSKVELLKLPSLRLKINDTRASYWPCVRHIHVLFDYLFAFRNIFQQVAFSFLHGDFHSAADAFDVAPRNCPFACWAAI